MSIFGSLFGVGDEGGGEGGALEGASSGISGGGGLPFLGGGATTTTATASSTAISNPVVNVSIGGGGQMASDPAMALAGLTDEGGAAAGPNIGLIAILGIGALAVMMMTKKKK